MHWKALLALPLIAVAFAGCAGSDEILVHFETSLGDFTVELFEEEAPITVENFLEYVDAGFYDNTLFHRISADFVIQGGGKDADTGAFKQTNAPIKNEAAESGLLNEKYTLSMARTTLPDSATSQFFINLKDNTNLDPGPGSDGYAVFAIVVEGRDVIDAIAAVQTKMYEGEPACQQDSSPSCPVEPVIVHRVWREGGEAPTDAEPTGPPVLSLGIVQQGDWDVTGTTDHLLVYVDNAGGPAEGLEWTLTGDGAALPDGWNVTFDPAVTDVAADGSKGYAQGRTTYPDTQYTLITLHVPEDTDGQFELELSLGDATLPVPVAAAVAGDVSHPGDSVTVTYRGYFDDGEEFDAGEFPTTLGSGQTVTGFDLGLLGLADGEQTTLRIPAPLAYGSDNSGRLERFNGQTLFFDVSLVVDES